MNDVKVSKNYMLSDFQDEETGLVRISGKLIKLVEKANRGCVTPIVVVRAFLGEKTQAFGDIVQINYHRLGVAALLAAMGVSAKELVIICEHAGFDKVEVFGKGDRVYVDVRSEINK